MLPWFIFVEQLGESPKFCGVLFHTERFSLLMPRSSGLLKLMSGELCSCFVVVLHICICRVLFLCSGLAERIMQLL